MDKKWFILDLGRCAYRSVVQLQEHILADKIVRPSENILILVEHEPVFTLGNRGDSANLKVNKCFLEARNIELVQTSRGGDITYHGPGQIVAYPIVSLKEHKLSIPSYVSQLEEVMLQTAQQYDVDAHRSYKNRGVWIHKKKLGSVGIRVKRWFSYHGLALNTNMDLTPFSWINPCGLTGTGVTSLADEGQQNISVPEVKKTLLRAFTNVFQVSLRHIQAKDLRSSDYLDSSWKKKTSLA